MHPAQHSLSNHYCYWHAIGFLMPLFLRRSNCHNLHLSQILSWNFCAAWKFDKRPHHFKKMHSLSGQENPSHLLWRFLITGISSKWCNAQTLKKIKGIAHMFGVFKICNHDFSVKRTNVLRFMVLYVCTVKRPSKQWRYFLLVLQNSYEPGFASLATTS